MLFLNYIHKFNNCKNFLDYYIDRQTKWHVPPLKDSLFAFAWSAEGNWIPQYTLRYENLDQDIRNLQRKAIFRYNIVKNIYKSSGKPNYKNKGIYTIDQVKKLNKIWKKDLEKWNYGY